MNLAYIRVSSELQHLDRQKEALMRYNIEKWFSDKASGKNTDRPGFKHLMEFAREGDTVYIHDFSRIARSTKDLLAILEEFDSKGIHLISDKDKIDTSTSSGKLMLTVIAAINQFERENLLERQREGIRIAKKKGVYKGRKKIKIADFGVYYDEYMARKINKVNLAKKLKISRPTLDKIIAEYEKELISKAKKETDT